MSVANWIKTHTPPDATIALIDVGLIPFEAERTTVDMVGLNDREVRRLIVAGTSPMVIATDLLDRDVEVFVLPSPGMAGARLISTLPGFREKYVLAYHQAATGTGCTIWTFSPSEAWCSRTPCGQPGLPG